MNARRLTTNAVGIALFVLLSYISIDFFFLKLTFASFPIIVSSLLFGCVDGMAVGAIGEFIHQMLTYGLTPTTILWVLPAFARGLIIGLYAQKRGFDLNMKQTAVIVLVSSLVVTALNTAALYLDAAIVGYPAGLNFLRIVLRFVSSVVMAAVYTAVSPQAVRLIRRSGVGRR
ncbi:MAG TPA: folate family ECF transporter S component [Candidatus Pullichristensenella avicola]|nr:folate family ECF transporter S component [Candidatus Pullichristensenella avicola]